MKQMKRTLSLILALVMLLSLGTTAFAGEVEEPVQVAEEVEQPVQPVVEAPVEAAPVAETPVEEAPAAETPVEEAPAAETPVEEAPAAETPVEEAPAAEAPVEEVPVVEETEPAEEPVVNAIVGQPQDLTVVSGERAVFSVEVTGNAVSFQWQTSRDNRRWSNMNPWFYGSTAELGFYPTRLDNGSYYRVVVYFDNGEQLISEAARLSVASILITAQPEDLSVEPNTEAVFTVGAKGSVYYYQWQYSEDGSRWYNLNTRHYGSSNTLRFVAEAEDDGLYIRALVYARDGNRLATEAAKLTVAVNEPEPEPVVTYEARTLAPEVSIPGVALAVDAPEGALPSDAVMNIEAVNAAPYEELTKALLGDNTEISYAMDINFSTEAEGEIEPNGDVVVYLTVPGISEMKDVSVVHISDAGVAKKLDLVPADQLPRPLGTDEIAFKSGEFSVYAVVGTGETDDNARLHVFFKDGEKEIASMWVKKGDNMEQVIYDPGVPYNEHKTFLGWSRNQTATEGLSIAEVRTEVSTELNTGLPEGTEWTYYAIQNTIYNLYYEDEKGVVFKTDSVTGTGNSLTTTVNATYTPLDYPTKGLIGWSNPEDPTVHVYKNRDEITLTGDVTLKPVIGEGSWLKFDENDGGAGVGNATYTPPAFVPSGKTAADAEPANPSRPGYKFAGWYTGATGGELFDFNQELRDPEVTVYAHWTAAETANYKVIIWAQKVTDRKDAADADKTYDYVNTYTIESVPVGTVITDTTVDPYKNYDNSYFGVTDLRNDSYAFEYRTYEIKNGAGAGKNEVDAAGDTVVNVYYDRALFTINLFPTDQSESSPSDPTYTFTGLYGQPFSMYGYVWPDENMWHSLAYLTSFNGNLFGDKNVSQIRGGIQQTPNYIGTYKGGTPNTDIYLYVEDPDSNGVYNLAGSFRYELASNKYFNITSRIQGTIPVSYHWSRSSAQPTSGWKTPGANGYTQEKRGDYTHLHIRYTLVKNDIVFMLGDDLLKTISNIPFGRSLAQYEAQTPGVDELGAIPEGYYFAGWYEDPEFVNPVDWTGTMPLANKTIYALVAKEEYHVKVYTNGGTLDKQQADNFWVPYQTELDDTYFVSATKPGYSLVGWFTDEALTKPYSFSTKLTKASLAIVYDGPDDPQRVEYGDNGYPGTVGVFKLYAKWRDDSIISAGGLHIKYVNADGTETTDPLAYTDQAYVTAAAAPAETSWPDGKQFDGWQLGTEKYSPGQTFIADKKYSENEGTETAPYLVITLTATYKDKETHTPTHITWFKNDGTDAVVREDVDLKINEAVDIPVAPVRDNYVFLGWAKSADATEKALFLIWDAVNNQYTTSDGTTVVTQVAADEVLPYDDLFAIWKLGDFYVYHSGVAGGSIETIQIPENGKYDLTSNLTAGTLYGGYYLEGGFTAPSANDDGVPTAACAAYDGDNWTWTTAQTASGKTLEPVAGVTYYIKEVPASRFLQPYTQYTYNRSNYAISTLWMISDIDDANYQETGFYVQKDNNPAKICTSLTVKTAVGNTSVTLRPETIFKLKGATNKDYLTYLKMIDDSIDNLVGDGDTVGMYWITWDGMFVTGTAQRTLTGVGYANTLKKSDKLDVTSTITPVTPSSESDDP